MKNNNDIILALPKGRIWEELEPIFGRLNIKPERSFYDENSRQLLFSSSKKGFKLIKIRSFDVATFVGLGAAQIGVAGNDVLMEFDFPDIYSPIDLKLGLCRLSVAAEGKLKKNIFGDGHIRVATKYPNITKKYFAEKGVQAECIKLNGAIELAPKLGLCDAIVDLVSSGRTLAENGLTEVAKISDISSRLIINRTAYKTRNDEINDFLSQFRKCLKS